MVVLSYVVDEPHTIYVWVTQVTIKPNNKLMARLNPQDFVDISSTKPRCYEIPYSKQTHKDLEIAKSRVQRRGGMITAKRSKKERKGAQGREEDGIDIEIRNPIDLLPKVMRGDED
jgi:hypothetical protein